MNATTLRRIYEKAKPFLPWLSLAWGITSAFLMTRSLSNTSRFLTVGAILVVFLILFQFFALWEKEKSAESATDIKTRRSARMQAGFSLLNQSAAQYILFFVLPFLYFAKSHVALFVTVSLATSTVWDPWWERLIRFGTYNVALRLWAASLLVSTLFSSFLSNYLGGFFIVLAAAQILASQFWFFNHLDRSFLSRILTLALSISFPAASFIQMKQHSSAPFPLVGVWLKSPTFTQGKPEFLTRDAPHNVKEKITAEDFISEEQNALRDELCCVTPLIASRSFSAPLSHVWSVNHQKIDEIILPPATGNGELSAFRTHSCKKNFLPLKNQDTVSCGVFAAGVKISELSLSIEAK